MKRYIAFVLTLCLLIGGSKVSASAKYYQSNATSANKKVVLSTLDNDECYKTLYNMGIRIPDEFSDQTKDRLRNGGLKEIIKTLESNPDYNFAVSYTVAHNFIESIRKAVKSYYGIANTKDNISTLEYTLKDSTLYSWNSSMKNYNCYAYALGRTSACDPGDFSNQYYDHTASISDVADLVKDDLHGSLGYKCVKVQTSRPSSTSGWSNVIAVRKDTTGDYFGFNDYHFAKLSSSSWLHKPGRTAVLKFKSAPTNSVSWSNECYDGTNYIAPSIWYESDIMYILYKSSHGSTVRTWTGNHYHSGSRHYYEYANVCNDCGEVASTVWTNSACSGPPCILPWSVTPTPEIY